MPRGYAREVLLWAGHGAPALAAKEGGSDITPILLVVVVLAVGIAAGRSVWGQVRQERDQSPAPVVDDPAPSPTASLAILEDVPGPSAPRRAPTRRRFEPSRRVPAARPPEPARQWVAEIVWRTEDGRPRFVVRARPYQGSEMVLLSSDAIEWPPKSPEDVAVLESVVGGLEAELLAAGWSGLQRGESWYAKRFAWAPRDAEPGAPDAGAAPSGRSMGSGGAQ